MQILTGLIILISLLDWLIGFEAGMMTPALVEAAWQQALEGTFSPTSLWSFFTTLSASFLHGDIQHLLGNMLFFWIFGSVILQLCGVRWWLTIFLLTSIGASLGQIFMNPGSPIPCLGASGSLMGFEGAYLGLVVRKPRPDPFVWPMAQPIPPSHLAAIGVFGVIMDLSGVLQPTAGDNIAYGAHIGGFISGIFVSFLRKD